MSIDTGIFDFRNGNKPEKQTLVVDMESKHFYVSKRYRPNDSRGDFVELTIPGTMYSPDSGIHYIGHSAKLHYKGITIFGVTGEFFGDFIFKVYKYPNGVVNIEISEKLQDGDQS